LNQKTASSKNKDLHKVLLEFLKSFGAVFDRDWDYTKEMPGIPDEGETKEQKQALQQMGLEAVYVISPDGTFINPKVEDETEDWGKRGILLEKYRKLKNMIDEKQSFSNDPKE
jgi:hypothetical protein